MWLISIWRWYCTCFEQLLVIGATHSGKIFISPLQTNSPILRPHSGQITWHLRTFLSPIWAVTLLQLQQLWSTTKRTSITIHSSFRTLFQCILCVLWWPVYFFMTCDQSNNTLMTYFFGRFCLIHDRPNYVCYISVPFLGKFCQIFGWHWRFPLHI